jgi:galactokinase
MKDVTPQAVKEKFEQLFPGEPLIVRAPGRINLIGEHTDYNDGFVMPAAIDKEILFAIAPATTAESRIHSLKYGESFTLDVTNPERVDAPMWANYLLGVLRKIKDEGHDLKPFNCVFGGNVPLGAGLSSSAAMECGFAFGIDAMLGLNIDKQKLIRTAQWAEHNYVGVKCGIMDQFASMMGAEGKVIMLDCRSLEFEYFPLDLRDYAIVLCNTNVKHSLVDSEYNTRRLECEAGVQVFQRHDPAIKSLRDVSPALVEQFKPVLKGKVYDRCLYVTQEIERVQQASLDLQRGHIFSFGKKMYETHDGLSKLYEVSCPELDFLVNHAKGQGVIGARMMGGGFGGCTINIVANNQVESFIQSATEAYEHQFNLRMDAYVVHIKDGTSKVNLVENSYSSL